MFVLVIILKQNLNSFLLFLLRFVIFGKQIINRNSFNKLIHMKTSKLKSLFTLFFIAFGIVNMQAQIYERTDTLDIPMTENSPTIDAAGGDEAWDIAGWQTIDNIWMPYDNDESHLRDEAGLKIYEGEDDFSARYKVIWSKETNLLYFFVEITDDVFVDGYEIPNGGYHNYDILEIFIDEDRSGGEHKDDTNYSDAENAFSYHMSVTAPADGEVQTELYALDRYQQGQTTDYAHHFKDFSMKKEGNLYTWEFSLAMYDVTYNPDSPEDARVDLYGGKISGLTLAYCDNDDLNEQPPLRDHFFGSVFVPESNYNNSWENADWYGVVKFVGDNNTSDVNMLSQNNPQIKSYVSNKQLNTFIQSEENGRIILRILTLNGTEIANKTFVKNTYEYNKQFDVSSMQRGIYLVEYTGLRQKSTSKIIIK